MRDMCETGRGGNTIRGHILRGLVLAAVLVAGSCAAPANDANGTFDDPAVNHPIAVEPSYQSLKITYSPADQGLNPTDAARFQAFVTDYRTHGNGKIAISAPSGLGANAAITYLAQRINEMGVSRDEILVATHDAPDGDFRVELNYITYQASTAPCGDWSEDLSQTASNKTAPNFGCAVQHNIAAMVADPRDLIGPRPMGGADANRRAGVITNYEQGKSTAAQQTAAQSGAVSDIGK